MKIGIFGGSFNPPHKMHKKLATELIRLGYVDKVIFVPTGDKYNKSNLIPAKHRINMIELMIKDNTNLLVSDYEIKSTLTYTYQTLDYFKKTYKEDEIYFICGSDNLKEITTWKEYEYILDTYKLLIIKRNNDDIDNISKNINKRGIIITNVILSDLSSTIIRKDLNNNKNNLDDSVIKYIIKNKLYS